MATTGFPTRQFGLALVVSAVCAGLCARQTAVAERTEAFFDSNKVKMRYLVEGSGEPLVLLHGFAAHSEMWEPLLPALAKDFRVISLDCRGHGKSDKPDTRWALRSLATCWFIIRIVCSVSRWAAVDLSSNQPPKAERGKNWPRNR